MRKFIATISFLILIAIAPALCFAAVGTVAQTYLNYPEFGIKKVIFTCIGSATDGSIPNTDTSNTITAFIKGYYLYEVTAYPTSGGTAPDADGADVFILDANDLDLLGCEDGSTTAYQGLNLIHATLPRSCIPDKYIPRAGLHQPFYPVMTGALTLKVANQATHSADYTIVLTFVR